MAFPVDERFVAEAESRLLVTLPAEYRAWLVRSNGGEVELADETWWLHPVRDDSARSRLSRTWDDVVRQTSLARSWPAFPPDAISIGDNGGGDRLVLMPSAGADANHQLARWDHETGLAEPIDGGVEDVFRHGQVRHPAEAIEVERNATVVREAVDGGLVFDRNARDLLIVALRRLMARQITNDAFEELMEDVPTTDRVVGEVYDRAWCLCSDQYSHHLDSDLTRQVRPELARWILFLQTDLEYRWPPDPRGPLFIYNWPLNLLTLGWWERRKARRVAEWERHGDASVWPFLSRQEFDDTRGRTVDPRP